MDGTRGGKYKYIAETSLPSELFARQEKSLTLKERTSVPILRGILWRTGPGEQCPGSEHWQHPEQSCLCHIQPASCGQKPPMCSHQHFRQIPHSLRGLGASNTGSESYRLYQSSRFVSALRVQQDKTYQQQQVSSLCCLHQSLQTYSALQVMPPTSTGAQNGT